MSDAVQPTKEQLLIIGTVFVNQSEFAIDASYIQEVVNAPERYSPMPLAPDYLVGLINLRGIVLPVLNLEILLNLAPECGDSEEHKIAIINYNGARVGFLLSATGEVIRARQEDICRFEYDQGTPNQVIQGALRLEGGTRILQILDPSALIKVQNLPQISASLEANRLTEQKKRSQRRRKCISFSVQENLLAFEITGIHEIVKPTNVKPSPLSSSLCGHVMQLRGQMISIVDFSTLLGTAPAQAALSFEDKKIIILKIESAFIGLLVDTIDSIDTYDENDVLPFPVLVKKRATMFLGVISRTEKSDILLLDPQKILSAEEVREVTNGHSRLFEASDEQGLSAQVAGVRTSYISFEIGELFGIPIAQIQEIIEYPDTLVQTPGGHSFVSGVLNLRNDLIPIIDARKLYGLEKSVLSTPPKILIIEHKEHKFGFVVDRISSIVTIDSARNLELPSLLYKESQKSFDDDIHSAVQIGDENAAPLLILRLERIVGRIQESPKSSDLPPVSEELALAI